MQRAVFVVVGLALSRQSLANPALIASDHFGVESEGDAVVDAGIVIGAPAALPTGLSRGIAAGFAKGDTFAWGVRLLGLTVTESTMAWQVTHRDLRLRATAALQHMAGRGVLALRLGAGGTLVHEARHRHQGERAGLTGADLATSAYAVLPAVDLDGVVSLHIAGPWLVSVSGGPALAIVDGAAHLGWSAQLGVAWQP